MTLFKYNTKASTNHKESGFTLIELMIVVGIIGILVAIAAPNFARYQSKARQAEAKIALSALYGGEKAFYSEYSAYITSLDAIGYVPEGLKRYYTVGFGSVLTTSVTGYSGATSTQSYARINFPASWTDCTPSVALGLGAGTTDPQSFTAAASGQLRSGVTSCDTWTITDTKDIRNVTIGL